MFVTLQRPDTGVRRLSDLQNEMDRLFRDLAGTAGSSARRAGWRPSADIVETDEAFEIRVELPGFERDDVQVTVDQGVLTVEGRRTLEAEDESRTFHLRERASGRFSRSFSLPGSVDPRSVAGRLEDGVLRLDLPKEEQAKTRKIDVNVS